VPRLYKFYPEICLTTEEKTRKNLSQIKKNLSQIKENLSQVKKNVSQVKKILSQVKENLSQVKKNLNHSSVTLKNLLRVKNIIKNKKIILRVRCSLSLFLISLPASSCLNLLLRHSLISYNPACCMTINFRCPLLENSCFLLHFALGVKTFTGLYFTWLRFKVF
jgi:uncharacterized membrane protein